MNWREERRTGKGARQRAPGRKRTDRRGETRRQNNEEREKEIEKAKETKRERERKREREKERGKERPPPPRKRRRSYRVLARREEETLRKGKGRELCGRNFVLQSLVRPHDFTGTFFKVVSGTRIHTRARRRYGSSRF